MTKMLDVLEAFLNFHGHIYLRLDGTTKVDQRQVLMERFNGDTRIFAFILSTRSGGVGVNLTGADTVIFYDSDWNPTMDAQAQDRCHRIGQTRDVHIYRLVSERTIEENILKKANQKRLLGDLAIEGGNFTTAYFKSSTIQDLFNIDQNEDMEVAVSHEIKREKDRAVESAALAGDEKAAMGALENALAACEDDQDVLAARTAKAEAVADLAEFDENIPLDDQDKEKEKEPEISKAEQEINSVIEKLSPIERYAMKFIETTEAAWSAEHLAAAEREIEKQKREWEQHRLAAMKEEEERRARELEEENDIITFSREDATNQVSQKSKTLNRSKRFNRSKILSKSGKRLVKRTRSSNVKIKAKRKRTKKLIRRPIINMSEEKDSDYHPDESQDSTTMEETQLNGDVDNSIGSSQSESNLVLSTLKQTSNHIDHNSPRTRSRGTVAINLWTLDVSPILPGEKPSRKSLKSNSVEKDLGDPSERRNLKRHKSSVSEEDSQSDDEKDVNKRTFKRKVSRKKDSINDEVHRESGDVTELASIIRKGKICKVILNDIVAEGQYVIPEFDGNSNENLPGDDAENNKNDEIEAGSEINDVVDAEFPLAAVNENLVDGKQSVECDDLLSKHLEINDANKPESDVQEAESSLLPKNVQEEVVDKTINDVEKIDSSDNGSEFIENKGLDINDANKPEKDVEEAESSLSPKNVEEKAVNTTLNVSDNSSEFTENKGLDVPENIEEPIDSITVPTRYTETTVFDKSQIDVDNTNTNISSVKLVQDENLNKPEESEDVVKKDNGSSIFTKMELDTTPSDDKDKEIGVANLSPTESKISVEIVIEAKQTETNNDCPPAESIEKDNLDKTETEVDKTVESTSPLKLLLQKKSQEIIDSTLESSDLPGKSLDGQDSCDPSHNATHSDSIEAEKCSDGNLGNYNVEKNSSHLDNGLDEPMNDPQR
ncbi:hypothetical protein NQ317_013925 [Molorchus minor]|uniref:Helicase C-terminal domain-containing protein n=1 Tax=Molorchus minor TaxID=1323400 RepID=A0ABQ9K6J8_9CUCU|nr:hypothetical protein NQ317_013925 [Molorchus minor]